MGSTTIRVSAETRDDLNRLCAQSGKSAGALVAELVEAAKQQTLLHATERHWHALSSDADALADYLAEAGAAAAFDSELEDY